MFARCVARKSIRVVVADCLIGCKVSWTSGVNVGRESRLINDMSYTTRPSISSWWKYTRFQV
jgi:hypothetical protein